MDKRQFLAGATVLGAADADGIPELAAKPLKEFYAVPVGPVSPSGD
jgi:hypothetical protein